MPTTKTESELRLGTVDDVATQHPGYTTTAIRTLVARADANGLSPHIYRVGRRVFIDLVGFESWVRQQQHRAAA
jgi:hypothetical protein